MTLILIIVSALAADHLGVSLAPGTTPECAAAAAIVHRSVSDPALDAFRDECFPITATE